MKNLTCKFNCYQLFSFATLIGGFVWSLICSIQTYATSCGSLYYDFRNGMSACQTTSFDFSTFICMMFVISVIAVIIYALGEIIKLLSDLTCEYEFDELDESFYDELDDDIEEK